MQGKLTALGVARLKKVGMHGDGHGLWLQVSGRGAKSWIFRYKIAGRAREMGLGSAHTFSLAEARDRARECRKLTADGVDPIEVRNTKRQEAALEAAKAVTFRACAEKYIEAHRPGWRNPVHAAQWPSSLENHVYPVLGDLPVQAIDTQGVMRVLEPIWTTRSETATYDREPITTCIVNWQTDRVSAAAVAVAKERWPMSLKVFKQALLSGLADHSVRAWPHGADQPEVQAVPLQTVKAGFSEIYPADAEDEAKRTEAKRKAFKRAVETCLGRGLIGSVALGGIDHLWLKPDTD